jgi:hypothetical protein
MKPALRTLIWTAQAAAMELSDAASRVLDPQRGLAMMTMALQLREDALAAEREDASRA